MRIAQVAPLIESVPPRYYGGTERVVHYLTEELVRLGHEVTLYASGDSCTSAHLRSVCECGLRLDPNCADPLVHQILLLDRLLQEADDFDLIHFHDGFLHFPPFRRHASPSVTTLHGRLDLPDTITLFREFADVPVVSISDAQRLPVPWANWQGTVYHGLPGRQFTFSPRGGDYLAFLGRISPEKRPDRAIRIACEAGIDLKIAAKVDALDRDYYESKIKPLLDTPWVEFIGEISEFEKSEFLGGAAALIFPIDWPEPFGLAMIEAMACGTPVIGYRTGSVPEVVDDGVTGFAVDGFREAVAAVRRIGELSRHRVRQVFEERFSALRMAEDYMKIYAKLATGASMPLRVA